MFYTTYKKTKYFIPGIKQHFFNTMNKTKHTTCCFIHFFKKHDFILGIKHQDFIPGIKLQDFIPGIKHHV
jgi:hypothetical protein